RHLLRGGRRYVMTYLRQKKAPGRTSARGQDAAPLRCPLTDSRTRAPRGRVVQRQLDLLGAGDVSTSRRRYVVSGPADALQYPLVERLVLGQLGQQRQPH